MPFIAKIIVYECYQCPFKKEVKESSNNILICLDISSKPTIAYNGILPDCPYNKDEKELISISDYVKERNF